MYAPYHFIYTTPIDLSTHSHDAAAAQQQQHMTRLQMQQKVIAMKQHQEQLLRPHTALDDQLDNEWFAHVNDFMAHEYQLLPLDRTTDWCHASRSWKCKGH